VIDLEQTDAGVLVPVRAYPKARRRGLTGVHAGQLKIAVTEPPEKGRANDSIAEILAGVLQVRPPRVSLVSGASSRSKRFLIAEATLDSVRTALARSLESVAQEEDH
jgi:uncharacterized protein